jgi:hypothetical protein
MEDEELMESPPPSPDEVARRAIILSVVSCRGIVDGDRANSTPARQLAKSSYDWLVSLGLEEELSGWERQVLTSPFGSLAKQDRINASWLSEAVIVLAWSLEKTELPGFEKQCDPADAANSLGFLRSADSTVLSTPHLRPLEDLREYNGFIYNLHWRVRDFSLNGRSYDFESLARKAWGDPILRHGLVLQDGDLSVGGVPISRAEEGTWRKLVSITRERHRASNWLIGYASKDFYEITTDT